MKWTNDTKRTFDEKLIELPIINFPIISAYH